MTLKIDSILTLAATALLAGSLFVGCKDTNYPDPQPTSAAPNTSARVEFANATADASAITTYLENMQVGNTLAVGQATSYTAVPFLGSLQFRIKGANTFDVSTKSTVVASNTYTAFVTDSTARPPVFNAANVLTDAGGVRLLVVNDPLSQTLTAGAGGVRFFDFVPDAGLPGSSTATTPLAVSLRISPIASTTALPATTASFLNRAYRNVATTAFTSVPAGTYRIDAFTGATLPTSVTTTAITSSTLTVEASKLYTLYANGSTRRRTAVINRIQHN